MATTPVLVLLISWLLRLESIKSWQMLSLALALPGVVMILSRGSLATLASLSFERGDLIFFGVMIAWSVYNVLQLRALPDLSFISRTCLCALVGAALISTTAEQIAVVMKKLTTPAMSASRDDASG